jgi:hypothetical protein
MEQINEINKMKIIAIKFETILSDMVKLNVLKYPSSHDEKGGNRKYIHFKNKNGRMLKGRISMDKFFECLTSYFSKEEMEAMGDRGFKLINNLNRMNIHEYHLIIALILFKHIYY